VLESAVIVLIAARTIEAEEKFVRDFVAAWTKVTELDRLDLR
jgi:catalase (peroxidase I)